ncbi:MAG: hypothetical protein LBG06_04630 [Deltaproteobacteria bacterium]|jgi:hypothetical protein|nr:hypothetical protein [Deltaproteobacteria bacterium]
MPAALRRLATAALAALCGFAGAFIFSLASGRAEAQDPARPQDPSARALVTGELRLVDGSGRTRLLMTLVRGKPRLFMLDDAGEYRLEMGLGSDGEPHVWLRDSDGASKVQLALSARGLPSLTLADQRGRERSVLALSREGEPTFLMRDAEGADRVAVWRDKGTEGLALADAKGQPILLISARDGERAEIQSF